MHKTLAITLATAILAGCGAMTGSDGNGLSGASTLLAAASAGNGFMWGVSTAGEQYEGGDTTSQWPAFELAGKTSEPSGMAADGLAYYNSDAGLAQGMGLNGFRTSIEWSRIEPRPGYFDPAGVAYYHRFFASLRAHGLTPVVTLMHFTYPQWLDTQYGGWANAQSVDQFAQYVDFVSKEYRNDVSWWLTFNEPNVFVPGAYLTGNLAPGHHNPIEAAEVALHFVEAHERAYTIIHQNEPGAHVSFNEYTASYAIGSPHATLPTPSSGINLNDSDWMLHALAPAPQPGGTINPQSLNLHYLDYVAIDYYCKWQLSIPFKFQMAWKWNIYPQGFYNVLENYHRWFGLPILVAENGLATRDLAPRSDGWTRSSFIVAHVQEMQKAMANGVPVLGYFVWSITDNWEWGSFSPRFGLYSVDCRDHDFRRIPTRSVGVYRQIATQGGVTPALEQEYPPPPGTQL